MKLLILFFIFLGNLTALQIKQNNLLKEITYEFKDGKLVTSENYIFSEDSLLLVKFNEENSELISEFEAKYFLELQEVLVIGYYLYKTQSNVSDILPLLIEEKNIKTVKPNWSRTVKGR